MPWSPVGFGAFGVGVCWGLAVGGFGWAGIVLWGLYCVLGGLKRLISTGGGSVR